MDEDRDDRFNRMDEIDEYRPRAPGATPPDDYPDLAVGYQVHYMQGRESGRMWAIWDIKNGKVGRLLFKGMPEDGKRPDQLIRTAAKRLAKM